MLKKEIAIIGLGLAGQTVAYGFQKKNYPVQKMYWYLTGMMDLQDRGNLHTKR